MGRIFSKKAKSKNQVSTKTQGVDLRAIDDNTPQDAVIPMSLGDVAWPNEHLQIFDNSALQASVRQGRRMLFGSAFMIGAGVIVALAGAFYVFSQNADRFSRIPYVFFEVKAIDADGHPVAGAKVKMSNHPMGVTDSFGEWRQFLRLKLGSSVALSVEKSSQKGEIFATKNLVIPLRRPPNGEVEMRQIIQLQTKEHTAEVPKAVASAITPPTAEATDAAPQQRAQVASDDATENAFAYNRISVAITEQDINKQANPTGFERQSYLSAQIVPQLKQMFIKAGLAIDSESPWKVSIKHVSAGDGQSLIFVETAAPGESAPRSFLRNYTTDPKLVAEQIFGLVRYHTQRPYQVLREDKQWYAIQPSIARSYWRLSDQDVLVAPKGETIALQSASALGTFERVKLQTTSDPCTDHLDAAGQCYLNRATIKQHPPRPGLTKQRLRYTASEGTQLYVLGFAAVQVAPHIFEYWAKSGEKANVTLVENGRVKLRTGVVNFTGRIATLAKPVETVARR